VRDSNGLLLMEETNPGRFFGAQVLSPRRQTRQGKKKMTEEETGRLVVDVAISIAVKRLHE